MFRWKRTPLTITAVASLAVLLLTGTILATENPVAAYVQQKFISLRHRVAEYLPQPSQPQFVPTPFIPVITYLTTPAPTLTPPQSGIANAPTTAQATPAATATPQPSPTPAVNLIPIQPAVALSGVQHERQGWNNCGPTTLKMYLSYYGRSDTQQEIATFTKPDPDDKNVSPHELTTYAGNIGMRALVRENGTLERLKLLLSNGLPVMIETGFVTPSGKEGWMGHYKLLIGYDDSQFIFMDSYNGPDQKITYEAMDADWRAFNRLYLIVFPGDQEEIVRAIVGDDLDDPTMYTHAVARAQAEIQANPNDVFASYNLGTSLNGLGQYTEAAAAFDHARMLGLPWRMMWYQFGPYVAYLQAGRYDEVITLADATLHVLDDLEESHYFKGLALRALKRDDEARREFETALRYNQNYQDAQHALEALPN